MIEDDAAIAELMALHLGRAGFRVTGVDTARDAVNILRAQAFDLVVLDLGLPDFDGLSVCRQMRQRGPNRLTPVLVVTARHSEADVVLALEGGADAVMRKPFAPTELLWRVNGLLRRCQPTGSLDADRVAVLGTGMVIEVARRTVVVESVAIALTRQEFDLLLVLARQPGRIFSRRALGVRVWGDDAAIDDRAVDIAISRLRRQLAQVPSARDTIRTVRGAGYALIATE